MSKKVAEKTLETNVTEVMAAMNNENRPLEYSSLECKYYGCVEFTRSISEAGLYNLAVPLWIMFCSLIFEKILFQKINPKIIEGKIYKLHNCGIFCLEIKRFLQKGNS